VWYVLAVIACGFVGRVALAFLLCRSVSMLLVALWFAMLEIHVGIWLHSMHQDDALQVGLWLHGCIHGGGCTGLHGSDNKFVPLHPSHVSRLSLRVVFMTSA
jgi:hypothetical protein